MDEAVFFTSKTFFIEKPFEAIEANYKAAQSHNKYTLKYIEFGY